MGGSGNCGICASRKGAALLSPLSGRFRGHLSPSGGEGPKSCEGAASAIGVSSPPFLMGERWFAKQTGEGTVRLGQSTNHDC